MNTLYNAYGNYVKRKIVLVWYQGMRYGGVVMLILNVLNLLEQKGKTKYWLYKRIDMSYQNFNKMVNNETASIKYEIIEKLCDILECTPNELFKVEK